MSSKLSNAPLDRITDEVQKLIDRVNMLLAENAKLKREIGRLKAAKPYPLRPAPEWQVSRGNSEWYKEKVYEYRTAISSGFAVHQYRCELPYRNPDTIIEIPDEIIDRLAALSGAPLQDLVHLADMIHNPD